MKLSNKTIRKFRNLIKINPNFTIHQGTTQTTKSLDEKYIITSNIPESFPSNFKFYYSDDFLRALNLIRKNEVSFSDSKMEIEIGNATIDLKGHIPSSKTNYPVIEISKQINKIVNIKKNEVLRIKNFMKLIKNKNLVIEGNGKEILMKLSKRNTQFPLEMTIIIGKTENFFSNKFDIKGITFPDDEYNLLFNDEILLGFEAVTNEITYFFNTENIFIKNDFF